MFIYSAESQVKNMKGVVKAMLSGARSSQYISYRLFLKDVRADYSKSSFGMLWDFIDPLVMALIFFFLQKYRVLDPGDITIPYPVFVIFGFLIYQTFMESVIMPLDCIRKSKNILTHLKLPPEALIISVFYRVLFNSSFRVAILFVFSLAIHLYNMLLYYLQMIDAPDPCFSPIGFVKFLILFPTVIFAGMAIGIFLAPFNTIYNDVGRVTRIILTPMRFLSPVMYTIPLTGGFIYIYFINPVAAILANLRMLATENQFFFLGGYFQWIAILSVVFILGWFIFHLSIPVLADRV